MGKHEKCLSDILCGTKDANISFSGLCSVLNDLGFICRIKGDHSIYTKPDIEEIINIQPLGSIAKPYQVKQVRNLILKYRLGDDFNV